MTTRLATLATAFALTAAALVPATAAPRPTTWDGLSAGAPQIMGTLDGRESFWRDPATCPMSSAAEGNANQQHFPVKQYGQTSGGNRC
jgi:hypothetical protein